MMQSKMGGRVRVLPWLAVAGGYTLIALAMTWPLATRIASSIPNDLGDPLLNTWILWWDAHRVPLTTQWWNAPIFWPMPGALGLSEHLLRGGAGWR